MTQSITDLFSTPESFEGNIEQAFIEYIKEKISIFADLKPKIIKSNPDSYLEFSKRVHGWVEEIKFKGDKLCIVRKKYDIHLKNLLDYLSKTDAEQDYIKLCYELSKKA